MSEGPLSSVSANGDPESDNKWAMLYKPLRLLLAVGIAQVIIGMLIGLFGHGHGFGPAVSFTTYSDQKPVTYTLPIIWLPLATIMICAGWGFLFAGVLHGRLWMRIGAAVLWAGGIMGSGVIQHYPTALVGAVIPLLLLGWRGWTGEREVFGVREFLILAGASTVFNIEVVYSSLMSGSFNGWTQYAVVLIDQFIGLMLVAFPVLFLTGKELGEFSETVGESIINPLEHLKSGYLTLILVVLSLIGMGYIIVTWKTPFQLGDALTALAIALLAWLAHKLPQGKFLAEPPVFILAVPAIVAVVTFITGTILATMLRNHADTWLNLSTGALAGGVVALILRSRLNNRWPGSADGTILVSVWTAWFFLANIGLSSWLLSVRGMEIAVVAGSIALALLSFRVDSPQVRKNLLAGLEIILALFVLIGIYDALAYGDIDLASLYADAIGIFVICSAVFAWLGKKKRYRLAGIVTALTILITGVSYFVFATPGGVPLYTRALPLLRQLQFLLVAVALLSKVPHAEVHFGEALGERAPAGSATFVYIGYVLMLVAILGLFQSSEPPIAELSDVHFALLAGLEIIYLPLFLLAKLRHIHWRTAPPPPAQEEKLGADA